MISVTLLKTTTATGGGHSVCRCRRLLHAIRLRSNKVVTVENVWLPSAAPQADGMVTNKPGILLGVLAADCVPVLLADIAGWGYWRLPFQDGKGRWAEFLKSTIEGMLALGAKRQRLRAAIGPAIGEISYEVGPGFRRLFSATMRKTPVGLSPFPSAHKFFFAIKPYVSFGAKSRNKSVDIMPGGHGCDSQFLVIGGPGVAEQSLIWAQYVSHHKI